MHKVDAPGADPANEFSDGDPQTGVPATTLEAKFMNTLQRELVNVVERENIALDDQDDGQVYQAMQSLIQKSLSGSIPAGTRMLFAQAGAPTGWTQDDRINDRVIRVVRGRGNGQGGSWTLTGLSHTHTHGYSGTTATPNSVVGLNYARGGIQATVPSDRAGHTYQGTTSAPTSSTVRSDGAWRPPYLDVIACRKN